MVFDLFFYCVTVKTIYCRPVRARSIYLASVGDILLHLSRAYSKQGGGVIDSTY